MGFGHHTRKGNKTGTNDRSKQHFATDTDKKSIIIKVCWSSLSSAQNIFLILRRRWKKRALFLERLASHQIRRQDENEASPIHFQRDPRWSCSDLSGAWSWGRLNFFATVCLMLSLPVARLGDLALMQRSKLLLMSCSLDTAEWAV